jgi:hypothetical protein
VDVVEVTITRPDGSKFGFVIPSGEAEFSLDDAFVPTGDKPADPTGEVAGPPQTRPANLETVALFDGSGPLRRLIVATIKRQTGATSEQVENAITVAESDTGRPLLDWITNGGLLAFIQAIVAILKLSGLVK